MVFVAEDVGEHSVLVLTGVLDKAHGDTADGSLEGHTSVHKGERAGADSGHRGRTVALEDIAHHAHGVGEVSRNLALQTAPSQVAVANFATANATLCTGFAGGERREVVVEEEALVTLVEDVVHEFLIQFCAERTGG